MDHWWQVPAVREELERILGDLDMLRASPPKGETAFFCDLCEVLTVLLDAGASFAESPDETHLIHEMRARLDRHLAATTYVDRAAIETLERLEDKVLSAVLDKPETKLAVYGTLAPGEVNHSQLAGISGEWSDGFVHGELQATGWGVEHGFPALAWRPAGPQVAAKLFVAPKLAEHWQRLDDFEGDGYRRILVPFEVEDEIVAVANVYVDRSVAITGDATSR